MSTEHADNKTPPDLLRDALAPRPLSDQKPPTTPSGGTVGGPRRGGDDEIKAAPPPPPPPVPKPRVMRGGQSG